MNQPWWLQLLQTVVFPALALAATGLVTVLVARMRNKLDKNTEITSDAASDQERGFRDIGRWRTTFESDIKLKLAQLEERLKASEDKMATVQRRVERIPTESQFGYVRELTPIGGLPTVAPKIDPVEK